MAFAREIFVNIKNNITFRQSDKEKDSYYTELNNALVRISNHCTYIYVWDNFLEQNPQHKGKKIISVVFEDNGDTFKKECLMLKRYRNKPIVVNEYVYPIHNNGQYITRDDIKKITQSLRNISNGEYFDTTGKCTVHQRVSENPPAPPGDRQQYQQTTNNNNNQITENKQKNMKQTMKVTESQLHQLIRESVKEMLTELDWKTYANAAEKMRKERGNIEYWNKKGVHGFEAVVKAGHARERAEELANAAIEAFNRDYGYKNGHWLDGNDYAEVGMGGRFGFTDEFAPHAAAWKSDPITLKKHFQYGVNTDERTPEEFFDGNPNAENAISAYNRAKEEMRNYKEGNYVYTPEKGWHLKDSDKLDEAIKRSIRKYLR